MARDILKVDSREVHLLRGGGGEPFAGFCDALIRGQMAAAGLVDASVKTNIRQNLTDGGVDTQVDGMLTPSQDPTGRMQVPTCWQYKACSFADISDAALRKELKGAYARRLITEGYGYRLCIAADMPPQKKQAWTNLLTTEVRRIRPDAPAPMVVTADDLAAWASTLPAVVLAFFHSQLRDKVLHLGSWGKNVKAKTETFVEVAEWQHVVERLRRHLDLGGDVREVVLDLQGEAGVGKTRLVYETAAAMPGTASLVLYALSGEAALTVATYLANESSMRAVLIADECSVEKRLQLAKLLSGIRKQVRVIAIDNSGERSPTGSGELWLTRIPGETVEEILAQNFPAVPEDRRRAYARLAEGFVRLAADLCEHDHLAAGQGSIPRQLRDYYRSRLGEQERITLEAVALLHRVGYADELAEELDALARLVGRPSTEIVEVASRLKDAPGFVHMGPARMYVTPEIIAAIAFESAFERWIRRDPQAFLSRIPDRLMASFQQRVRNSATEEMRRAVGDFFFDWAAGLEVSALHDEETLGRLLSLGEIDPATYLPRLRELVERASEAELQAIPTHGRLAQGWGGRRALVWLAERLAWLPEFLADVEAILFRLAEVETEPGIGNNATEVWKGLFPIMLPGSSAPFGERIRLLEERLASPHEEQVALAVAALSAIFEPRIMRTAKPPLIAGRVPPEEHPPTLADGLAAMERALDVLADMARSLKPTLQRHALAILGQHVRRLLDAGFLERIREIYQVLHPATEERLRLIQGVEDFLYFEGRARGQERAPYLDEVARWLETLRPADLHGRLVTLVGPRPLHHAVMDGEETWQAALDQLADEVMRQPEVLDQERAWLFSRQAESAAAFGEALGRSDARGACLARIVEGSLATREAALLRGYVAGRLAAFPETEQELNELLDDLEGKAPRLAYDLAIVGGHRLQAVPRTLRLLASRHLEPGHLRAFLGFAARGELSPAELRALVLSLCEAAEAGQARSTVKLALELVGFALRKRRSLEPFDAEGQELVWRLLELGLTAGGDAYHWGKLLERAAQLDPRRAAALGSRALVADDSDMREHASKLLIQLGKDHPREVLEHIKRVMLDAKLGSWFFFHHHRELFAGLPLTEVKAWLEAAGVEVARRIARHLPPPYTGDDGRPVVPELTAFVLERFAEDERVFKEFRAGVHSSQSYVGDYASLREGEARFARQLRNHPLRRIREWAAFEIKEADAAVRQWRKLEEELPGDL